MRIKWIRQPALPFCTAGRSPPPIEERKREVVVWVRAGNGGERG
jgi:hypothetical protein